MAYLLFILTGLVSANGVPHFIKGMTGEKHRTPFKNPSSAATNVLWGAANLYVATWLFKLALDYHANFTLASISVLIGVLSIGVPQAILWSRDDKARGK
jgi:hypothetical protein